ncbi:hypothetical protein MRX96_015079 [Rhipicephalus microplus]
MEAVLLQRQPRGRGRHGHRPQWRPFCYRDGPVDEVATAIVPNGGRSATETGPWTRSPRPSSPMEAVLLQRQPRGRGRHGHRPQWRPFCYRDGPVDEVATAIVSDGGRTATETARGRGPHGHRLRWRPFCYRDGPVDEVATVIVSDGGRTATETARGRGPHGRGGHGHRPQWRPFCYRDGPVDEVATAIVPDGGRFATETAPWTRRPRSSSPMEAVLLQRQPRGRGRHGHRPQWRPFCYRDGPVDEVGHGHRPQWRPYCYRDGPVDEVATAIVSDGGRSATETAPGTRSPRPSSPMEAVLLQRRPLWTRSPRPSSPMEAVLLLRRARGRGRHGHRLRWRPFSCRDSPVDEVATAIVPNGGRFATETAPWTRSPRPSSPMEAVLLQRRPVDEVPTAIVSDGGRSATETAPWTRSPRSSSPMEAVLLQRQPRGRGRHGHRPQWRPFCYRDGPVDEVAMAIVPNGGRSATETGPWTRSPRPSSPMEAVLLQRQPRGRGRHGHRPQWRPYCYRDGPVDEVAMAIVSDGGRSATETAPWTRSPRPSSPMEAVLLQRQPRGRGRHGHRLRWRPYCYRDGPVDEVATGIVPKGGRSATERAPWTWQVSVYFDRQSVLVSIRWDGYSWY